MKSAKKSRILTAPKAKTRKTCAVAVKTSAPKKKTAGKATASSTSHSQAECSPKSCKIRTVKPVKSTNRPTDSGKSGKSPAKRNKDRRHHELSVGEYDAFVTQTAACEKVTPEQLVTVERRKDKSTMPRKPVTKQEPLGDVKQDRRQKIQRRRQIDPTTCERDYSQEEIEFMNALNEYKRNSGRMFPTCSEILEVFCSLGYAKTAQEGNEGSVESCENIEICATPESGNDLLMVMR